MVSIYRYYEIADSRSRFLSPIDDAKVALLGEICSLDTHWRMLDLGSGKAEMLCRFALGHGCTGIGVDNHSGFVRAAKARVDELGLSDSVRLVEGDAVEFATQNEECFDVVACLGASFMCDTLEDLLELMRLNVRSGGLLLVGEPFWVEEPPVRSPDNERTLDLVGTANLFERAGLDLIEMVATNSDDWDRYEAPQWLTIADWLDAHPGHPDADEICQLRDRKREEYLGYLRRCLGWAVFVLRPVAALQ